MSCYYSLFIWQDSEHISLPTYPVASPPNAWRWIEIGLKLLSGDKEMNELKHDKRSPQSLTINAAGEPRGNPVRLPRCLHGGRPSTERNVVVGARLTIMTTQRIFFLSCYNVCSSYGSASANHAWSKQNKTTTTKKRGGGGVGGSQLCAFVFSHI